MGPYQVLPLPASMDLGKMAMKGYSTFPRVQRLKPHHQTQFRVISKVRGGQVLPLCRYAPSIILQPQPTGLKVWVKPPEAQCTGIVTGLQSPNNVTIDEVPWHILDISCRIQLSDKDASPGNLRDGNELTLMPRSQKERHLTTSCESDFGDLNERKEKNIYNGCYLPYPGLS